MICATTEDQKVHISKLQVSVWRCDRHLRELDLVRSELVKGNTSVFAFEINERDVKKLRDWCLFENKRDTAASDPWYNGLARDEYFLTERWRDTLASLSIPRHLLVTKTSFRCSKEIVK
jgi:hypothetical protein